MNHKRKDVRGHIRRKFLGKYRDGKRIALHEETNQEKKVFLRVVQASQIGIELPVEDERP